jgi:hypothetical protein
LIGKMKVSDPIVSLRRWFVDIIIVVRVSVISTTAAAPVQIVNLLKVSNCNIIMKQKILVINEMKRDKILLRPKAYDHENLCQITVNFC